MCWHLPYALLKQTLSRDSGGALVIIAGLTSQHARSGNGLPQINGKALAALAKQHPVVVLFRHAERCDRSDNTCLSDSTGITVNGAQDARALGKAFSADIQNYNLYSSNTVRTIQSATRFSAGRSLTVDKNDGLRQRYLCFNQYVTEKVAE